MGKYETYPMPEGVDKENQKELTRQRLEALKTQKEIEEGVDALFEGATKPEAKTRAAAARLNQAIGKRNREETD